MWCRSRHRYDKNQKTGAEKSSLYDKNVVALRNDRDVIAVGNDAYEIFEKNPQNVQVIWPMSGGVIANLTEMGIVLSSLLKHFSGAFGSDASLYIAVPSEITQVERRAFFHVMNGKINAGKIRLIDKGIADAVSAELPVLSSRRGNTVVNIGADTTEISVISSGKVILNQTLKTGGRRLDEDICTMVRRKFNLSIGRKTARSLEKAIWLL